MLRAGFEPEIPATKRLQTYALEHAAIGICVLALVYLNLLLIYVT
jgi:hypothetical protein